MNRSLMNKDLHSPALIRASVPADKEEPLQVASKTTSSNGIKWSRIIRLALLIGILSGGVYARAPSFCPYKQKSRTFGANW